MVYIAFHFRDSESRAIRMQENQKSPGDFYTKNG